MAPSKKVLYFFLISFLLISSFSLFLSPKQLLADDAEAIRVASFPSLHAQSAIVIDSDNNQVLWSKNADEKMYPASTTKIMTAILALENIEDLDEVVTISRNASGRLWSKFAFQTGDKVSARDLLKAALMISHNGAAIALAEHISGSEAEFSKLMNEKAKEIGASNTNFKNSNGLDSNYPSHKSTVADLALIGSYAVKNEEFNEISGTQTDYIEIKNRGRKIELNNTNAMIFNDFVISGKTGYTKNAGHTIVNFSQKNGSNLITVLLRCGSTARRREDSARLIDWAHDNYRFKRLIHKDPAVTIERIMGTAA
jgi:serine-type D-Ala-D-Ala carboxypeptidase (penicillin-binding protein 5/6)